MRTFHYISFLNYKPCCAWAWHDFATLIFCIDPNLLIANIHIQCRVYWKSSEAISSRFKMRWRSSVRSSPVTTREARWDGWIRRELFFSVECNVKNWNIVVNIMRVVSLRKDIMSGAMPGQRQSIVDNGNNHTITITMRCLYSAPNKIGQRRWTRKKVNLKIKWCYIIVRVTY